MWQALQVLDTLEGYNGPGLLNLYERVVQEVELAGGKGTGLLYIWKADSKEQDCCTKRQLGNYRIK